MNPDSRIRLNLFATVIGIVLFLMILRLVQLQIVQRDLYQGKAMRAGVMKNVLMPPRGLVYDRNGKLIADNEPTYAITYDPVFFERDLGTMAKRLAILARVLEMPAGDIRALMIKARKENKLKKTPIIRNVPFSMISRLEEYKYELAGIDKTIEQKRRYYHKPRAAHILGYLKEINEKEYDELKDKGYDLGQPIGKTGIERYYEEQMRGQVGAQLQMRDSRGHAIGPYKGGKSDTNPISGHTFNLTIDAKLQALTEYVFKNKRGGAVAIDPNNGEILSLVSAPDYNPALLAGSIDRRIWNGLQRDPNKPLYNRATQALEPPGSTFKPFMGLIGLQEGGITPESRISCGGRYGPHKCMGHHGSINVGMAIEKSCNVFFYTLMSRTNLANWNRWAHRFGFGEKPPIDLLEKKAGVIPDSARMDRTYGSRSRWKTGNTVIFGIGQGITVSPLQMARTISIIANGGTPYVPHLVRSMIDPHGKKVYPPINPKPERLPIRPEYFKIVQDGMRRSAMITNRRFVVWDTTKIGGKTGTAQAGKGRKDHSWFVGFAPLHKPKIVVAVLVENAGFGASAAAPIASLMMQQYLEGDTKGRSPDGVRGKASANMGTNRIDWTVGADTLINILKNREEVSKTLTNPLLSKPLGANVVAPVKPSGNQTAVTTPTTPVKPTKPEPTPPTPAPPKPEAVLPTTIAPPKPTQQE